MNDWPKGVAKPGIRALNSAGLYTIADLSKIEEKELMALHGMGKRTLEVLRKEMEQQGIKFKKD
ncbi:hypothetical protein ACWV26_11155 [Rummeliibacillus sp. JY-2-4R]